VITRQWVRLPTGWIEQGGLQEFRWSKGNGSNNVAALITLMVIAHHADDETGMARLTYDAICKTSGLSRPKLSAGLQVLLEREIIQRAVGRSTYRLANYSRAGGWGMLPALRLYSGDGSIPAFTGFSLRSPAELIALKLYLLFVCRRDRNTNMAHITYDGINRYTSIDQNKIKTGLSLLIVNGLIHLERVPSEVSDYGIANAYRLAYVESLRHMGTTGRGYDAVEFDEAAEPVRRVLRRAEDAL
jgi:hypothetical protein